MIGLVPDGCSPEDQDANLAVMTTLSTVDDRVWREIQMMTASGWSVHRRGPERVDFVLRPSGSGISGAVHVILLVITFGLWLPILILVELASAGKPKYCRLTLDDQGQPRYEPIGRSGK